MVQEVKVFATKVDGLSLILRENMVEEGNTGPDTCSHTNNLVNETPERSLCCRDRLAAENFSTLTLDSEWWCRILEAEAGGSSCSRPAWVTARTTQRNPGGVGGREAAEAPCLY